MPVKKLKEFLDKNKVKYVSISHSVAYTAQEIAASAHVKAKELAKTVIVKLDGKMAMVVMPANMKVDLQALKKITKVSDVDLAQEGEFRDKFPGCELGAMPPFGNLYDMDVYVSTDLAEDDEIVFNAGSHSELIRLKFKDFEKLVKPKMFATAQ